MIDIVNGQVRIRAWPKKRGKPKSKKQADTQIKFGIAQRIWRALSPAQQQAFAQATAGTPLLPRDLLTAAIYERLVVIELPDGKVLYQMPFYADTSAALDTITQTPGEGLVRGPDGWIAGSPGGVKPWNKLSEVTITDDVTEVVWTDLVAPDELKIIFRNIRASTSAVRRLLVSTTNGSTWFDGPADYEMNRATFSTVLTGEIRVAATGTTNPVSAIIDLHQSKSDLPAIAYNIANAQLFITRVVNKPITALKLMNQNGLLTEGTIEIYGR